MEPEQANYVIDLTDVREFARHNRTITGIQRVVLRAIAHLIRSRPSQVKLICFDPETGEAVEIQSDWCTPDYSFDPDDFNAWFNPTNRTILQWARRRPGRPLLQAYDLARAGFNRLIGRRSFFHKRGIVAANSSSKLIGQYRATENDVIIILGGLWTYPRLMDGLARYRERGARIVFFIHDLIPHKFPDLVPVGPVEEFRNWLPRVYSMASGLIANSFHTAADIEEDLAARGGQLPVEVAQLAHEFSSRVTPVGSERSQVRAPENQPYVLYFGTFSKRKNLLPLVRAWIKLGQDIGSAAPRLILAGKLDWGGEPVIPAVAESNGLVSIVDRPSDGELAYLMQNCLFTVYPSLYEGWGLPIGESLWFGKTCVASSASSMPEVGGDMCAYFDPSDPDEMYSQIKRMILDNDYRSSLEAQITRDKLRTWADFSHSLDAAIGRIVARSETSQVPGPSSTPAPADAHTITIDTSPSSAP